MSTPYDSAIEAIKKQIAEKDAELTPLRQQLAEKEATLNPLKITANELCKLAGLAPEYSIVEVGRAAAVSGLPQVSIRPDQFYNKELGEAVVEYLTAKKEASGGDSATPASVDEIYNALIAGGYKFYGTSDSTKKNALKTAMTRNTAQMAKINDDLYGLRKWYGMRAARKSGSSASAESPALSGSEDGAGDEGETDGKSPSDPQ
jgi:hypothetical protein